MAMLRMNVDLRERLDRAQRAADAAVLELSRAQMPVDTGRLRDSGVAGPPGTVRWLAPHAAAQYYGPNGDWVARMQAAQSGQVAARAAEALGGRWRK